MVQKTRKVKALSIPQLRKSFDHIDAWVEAHVKKGKVKDLIPAFQKEWKKTFHKNVDAKAAEAYLSIKAHAAPRMSRKHKGTKQHGGTQELSGAPLDYMTRQGVYGVYGAFPEYVSSGLRFYNDINLDSLTAQCGKENITPNIPADMGSNAFQKGGRKTRSNRRGFKKTRKQLGGTMKEMLTTLSATTDTMLSRPYPGTSPVTMGHTALMSTKGVDVSVPSPGTITYTPQAYDPLGFKQAPAMIQPNLPGQITNTF